eukprot:jgi/Tetstr1/447326/TSEL_034763.t1
MPDGDILDAAAQHPNMFTGQTLGDAYRQGAESWANLPVYANKPKLAEIVQSLTNNQVTIISSGTGSGKTVVVPKLCVRLAKTFGSKLRVAVTNPKTATTVENAKYSAQLAEVPIGSQIGYLTRNEKNTAFMTVLEYLTDGFLLGSSRSDPLFSKYAFLCIDEVHERPVPTDFLLLAIRNALSKRKDLRLVLMSATIEPALFMNYFQSQKISTQFVEVAGQPNKPISQLFMKTTPTDYIKSAVATVDDILARDPKASILVFVATAKDCTDGCNLLKSTKNCYRLFAKVSALEKEAAIAVSPDGAVKVVFATNLAESSITFRGLDYVVDSGKSLSVRWDPSRNMNINKKDYISKAEVKQRMGRVGRTKEGTVYHLYTKDLFEKGKDTKGRPFFPDQPSPAVHNINPVDELFNLAASEQHRGNWTGAMRDAMNLVSPPTAQQVAMTEQLLNFYRCIGPIVTGGLAPPTDENPSKKQLSNTWRMSAVGYAIHDIGRVFRTTFHNSIMVLAGMLYGAVPQVLKVVAITEATSGDLNMLWKTDKNGNPMSVMDDKRVADPRSDHITLANIFDSLGFLDTDFKLVPRIQESYVAMMESARGFNVNRREEILENWPWCIGNQNLSDPKEQFGASVLIARLFNACKVGKDKKAKSLYIEGLTVTTPLPGASEGDVLVCENFSNIANKNTASVGTAFVANVNLKCAGKPN